MLCRGEVRRRFGGECRQPCGACLEMILVVLPEGCLPVTAGLGGGVKTTKLFEDCRASIPGLGIHRCKHDRNGAVRQCIFVLVELLESKRPIMQKFGDQIVCTDETVQSIRV